MFEAAALVFEDEGRLVYADRIDCGTEERHPHRQGDLQGEAGAGGFEDMIEGEYAITAAKAKM